MANCQLPPPDAMVCTGNVAANWKVFKEAYSDFATATELTNKDDEIQAVTLKTVMGKECRQILFRLELSNADKKKLNKILEKLEEYLHPLEMCCTNDIYSTWHNNRVTKPWIST